MTQSETQETPAQIVKRWLLEARNGLALETVLLERDKELLERYITASIADAATQMRTACVALVREHERRHYGEMRSQTHKELISLLESLTLDQVKQK